MAFVVVTGSWEHGEVVGNACYESSLVNLCWCRCAEFGTGM